jgi:hypothetical protein
MMNPLFCCHFSDPSACFAFFFFFSFIKPESTWASNTNQRRSNLSFPSISEINRKLSDGDVQKQRFVRSSLSKAPLPLSAPSSISQFPKKLKPETVTTTVIEETQNGDNHEINQYTISKTIGTGSFGKVKMAINNKTREKRVCFYLRTKKKARGEKTRN